MIIGDAEAARVDDKSRAKSTRCLYQNDTLTEFFGEIFDILGG
jgi:hypothetical protein